MEILYRDSIANAAAIVSPAVVHITVKDPSKVPNVTVGSGTLIDPDGTILTCSHTIASLSLDQTPIVKGPIEVTLQDGKMFAAILVDIDASADIALLKINSTMPLPTAKLGKSAKLRPGDLIIALGSPKSLRNSVACGIISCVDRKGSVVGLPVSEGKYLQVDCAINLGNSGGPLINIDGEVVGVVLMSKMNSEGLHFAIPIDSVSEIIEHFKKHRIVDCYSIGVKVISKFEESNSSISKGISILKVTRGSPADHAGIRRLDVITALDETSVRSPNELNEYIARKFGQNVHVVVERENFGSVCLKLVPLPFYVG